jgi:hypothetical protein
VHWQCRHYRCDGNRVSFDFALSATAADDGSRLQRDGVEHIEFDARGLIGALQVNAA